MAVTTANQTWVQNGLQVHQDYLDALAVQFGVEAVAADFAGEPEQMRTALNDWVSEKTNTLIPELFPPDSITTDTLIVLVIALYLKASWPQPFSLVEKTTFTTLAGVGIHPRMMRSPSALRGQVGSGWSAVSIPYRGGGASMTVLVPDAGRFAAVLAGLDSDLMRSAEEGGSSVRLTLPLFALDTMIPAKDVAAFLGIEDIFGGTADLSGIAGRPGDLMASELLHQAVVTVDENGTEAAAATAVVMEPGSAPNTDRPIELSVDRPFLFWISERVTGAPLFPGVVTDPSA